MLRTRPTSRQHSPTIRPQRKDRSLHTKPSPQHPHSTIINTTQHGLKIGKKVRTTFIPSSSLTTTPSRHLTTSTNPQKTQKLPLHPTNPTRSNIESIYDLSYPQFNSILTQSTRLRFKVDPLISPSMRPPQLAHIRGGINSKSVFNGLKPLVGDTIMLLHQLGDSTGTSTSTVTTSSTTTSTTTPTPPKDKRRSKHEEVLKSNLAHIPGLLGAKDTIVVDENLIDIEMVQNSCHESFCKLHKLDTILNKWSVMEEKRNKSQSVKLTKSGKPRKKKTKSKIYPLNEQSIYNQSFLDLLTPDQQEEYKLYQDQEMTRQWQMGLNNSLEKQKDPVDIVFKVSTSHNQTNLPSVIKRLHPPTGSSILPDGNNDSIKKTPMVTLQSETTSLLSLLNIFSLLPNETLLHNPNSLKIAYIGFDYANNTNFVPELIYLCRRLGVNLSLSTPSLSTQFTDMKLFEQSCLASDKPIPITKKSKRANLSNNKKNDDGDDDNDDNKDESIVDIDETLYDDLTLLEAPMYLEDPSPGLSPHSTNIQEIKAYSNHLKALDTQRQQQQNSSLQDASQQNQQQQQNNDQHGDGPELLEDAVAAYNNTLNPTKALQMLKKTQSTAVSTSPQRNSNAASSQKQQTPTTTTQHKIDIQPALVEYSHHPFIAVQHADIIITNTIFPATTHSYMEHPSFELDKEMCSFAKDTVKIFHMTEGLYNWSTPPLGVHDPRCMLEQQCQNENYILASIALVMMGKEVH